MLPHRPLGYIGSTPYLFRTASSRRARRHAGTRAGQRLRPAARVAAAVMPSRKLDVRGGRSSRTTCATDAYWVSLLRYIGCTGHAHEVAMLFGDEIAIRAQTLVHDAGNPAEVMRDVVRIRDRVASRGGARSDRPDAPADGPRVGGAQLRLRAARSPTCSLIGSTSNRASARRSPARSSAGTARAFRRHVGGDAIPLPMRIVHLSHDMEAIGRLFSPEQAIDTARDRRDRTYDPALADLFLEHGAALVRPAPRDRAVGRRAGSRAEPRRVLEGEALDHALEVAADFIDLKSPFMGGHSRRCAQLATDAARVLGFSDRGHERASPRGARPRLRHERGAELDLGQARPAHAQRSSTASSCTRCLRSRCSAVHPPSPR